MKENIAQTGQQTQGNEVTEEFMECSIESILAELLLHFDGEQAAVSLETSGRQLISRGLERALHQSRRLSCGSKEKAVS